MNNSPFPSIYPLNGSDYFQVLLDKHHRKTGLIGNVSRFSITLDGEINVEYLEKKLRDDKFLQWLHSLRLRLRLPFQLPVWKSIATDQVIRICKHEVDDLSRPPDFIFQPDINPAKKPPFYFDLLEKTGEGSILVFSWNHILMDARGAEILLKYIGSETSVIENLKLFQGTSADGKEKKLIELLNSAKAVKQFLLGDKKLKKPALLSKKKQTESLTKYRVIDFDQEETGIVEAKGKSFQLRFGKSPLLLAATTRSFEKILEKKGKTSPNFYWIPIPQDQRRKGIAGPVMSNQVSYLFYWLNEEDTADLKAGIDSLTRQMFNQVKDRLPAKYNDTMEISRRLPLWLFSRMVKSPTEGALASFFFSDTGNSLDDFESFHGVPVQDAVHYPPNAGYPGFTVIFMTVKGRLKAVVGHTPDSVSEERMDLFEKYLRQDLVGK